MKQYEAIPRVCDGAEFATLWERARSVDKEEWGGSHAGALAAYQEVTRQESLIAPHAVLNGQGRVEAVFGVTSSGIFWLLGTETLNDEPRTLLRMGREFLQRWDAVVRKPLWAYLLKDNTKHIRWLKNVEFEPMGHMEGWLVMRRRGRNS